jgi:hypothetical protein
VRYVQRDDEQDATQRAGATAPDRRRGVRQRAPADRIVEVECREVAQGSPQTHNGKPLSVYDVIVDGDSARRIEQCTTLWERRTPGKRYVNARGTRSQISWRASEHGSVTCTTRRDAVADLLGYARAEPASA